MTARISLSRKDACSILAICDGQRVYTDAVGRLRAAIHKKVSTKLRDSRRAKVATKKQKRLSKKEQTSAIYEAVAKRADGYCESCGSAFRQFDPPHLDHQLGRGKHQQSVANCWLIHGYTCHEAKHAARPSAAYWWEKIRAHAIRHGHMRTAQIAGAAIEAEALVAKAERISRAAVSP